MLSKFIFFLLINIYLNRKYPIYEEIDQSKKNKNKKTIDVSSYEDYVDTIKNNNNVIAYFHSDWCEECEQFLPIYEEASKYKIINKKWKLLEIDCARNSHVCMNLGMDQYPQSEIYVNHEIVSLELPTELVPLLELLYKLSTNPIVRIKSKEEFFKKYGYYSPIIEVEKLKEREEKEAKKKEKIIKKEKEKEKEDDDDDDKEDNEENNKEGEEENAEKEKDADDDFLGCMKRIANTDFIQTFYFGLTETTDYKEKIVFENDNYPVTYLWDGICQNAIDFLNANKYPLLSNVDKYLLKELDDDPRTLVTLVTFPDNTKINYFIYSMFKKLAYENRKYIFGFVNYTEDPNVFDYYFKIELNSTNEIQLIMNNFEERSYYMHKPVFNVENQTEKEIFEEMKILVANMSNLNFETGSRFQDFINYIGFNKMDTMRQIILIVVLIIICIGCVYFFGNPEDLDDDLYEYEEVETDPNGKEKSK